MEERELLTYVLKADQPAIAMIEGLAAVSQVWDDLIDKDPVSDEQIHAAFGYLLVDLPQNPFYRRHQDYLLPLFQHFILDWQDATELEKGSDHDQSVAYVLRDSFSSLVGHCALLVGGLDWYRHVALTIRRHIFDEPLNAYKEGLHGQHGRQQ